MNLDLRNFDGLIHPNYLALAKNKVDDYLHNKTARKSELSFSP